MLFRSGFATYSLDESMDAFAFPPSSILILPMVVALGRAVIRNYRAFGSAMLFDLLTAVFQ